MRHLYRFCCSCMGKTVRVQTRERRIYAGRVVRVTPQHLYLMPVGQPVHREKDQYYVAHYAMGESEVASVKPVFFFGPFIVPLAAIIGLTIVGTAPFWGGGPYGPYGFSPYGYW